MAQRVRYLLHMQDIRSSNPQMVTGICDPNKYPGRHHRSLKFGSKLKYPNIDLLVLFKVANSGTPNLPNL